MINKPQVPPVEDQNRADDVIDRRCGRGRLKIRLLCSKLDRCRRVLAGILESEWFDCRSIVHRAVQIQDEVSTMSEGLLKGEGLTSDGPWMIPFRNQWHLIRSHHYPCPCPNEYLSTRLSRIVVWRKPREKCVCRLRDELQRIFFCPSSFSTVFWWVRMGWSKTSNDCSLLNVVYRLPRWRHTSQSSSLLIYEWSRCSPFELDRALPSSISKTKIQRLQIVTHGTVSTAFSCKWWTRRREVSWALLCFAGQKF